MNPSRRKHAKPSLQSVSSKQAPSQLMQEAFTLQDSELRSAGVGAEPLVVVVLGLGDCNVGGAVWVFVVFVRNELVAVGTFVTLVGCGDSITVGDSVVFVMMLGVGATVGASEVYVMMLGVGTTVGASVNVGESSSSLPTNRLNREPDSNIANAKILKQIREEL